MQGRFEKRGEIGKSRIERDHPIWLDRCTFRSLQSRNTLIFAPFGK